MYTGNNAIADGKEITEWNRTQISIDPSRIAVSSTEASWKIRSFFWTSAGVYGNDLLTRKTRVIRKVSDFFLWTHQNRQKKGRGHQKSFAAFFPTSMHVPPYCESIHGVVILWVRSGKKINFSFLCPLAIRSLPNLGAKVRSHNYSNGSPFILVETFIPFLQLLCFRVYSYPHFEHCAFTSQCIEEL